MTEIDVSVTDFILSFECLIFAYFFFKLKGEIGKYCLIVFLSIGFSAFAGGVHHGFKNYISSSANSFIWWLTLLLIGITAYGFALIGISLISEKKVRLLSKLSFVFLLIYIVMTVFYQSFLTAIIFYFPSILLASAGLYKTYQRQANNQIMVGIYGLGLSLMASVLQQLEVGIRPYLTYNAVYHLILMVALFMFFIGLRAMISIKKA